MISNRDAIDLSRCLNCIQNECNDSIEEQRINTGDVTIIYRYDISTTNPFVIEDAIIGHTSQKVLAKMIQDELNMTEYDQF